MELVGLQVQCSLCCNSFYICRRCFRGQKYCSGVCRDNGYKIKKRNRQKKYSLSFKGKLNHSKRQSRYRKKIKLSIFKNSDGRNSLKKPNSSLFTKSKLKICILCKKTILIIQKWSKYESELEKFNSG